MIRWIIVSLLVHVALLGGAFYYFQTAPVEKKEVIEPEVQAPLGSVYVDELPKAPEPPPPSPVESSPNEAAPQTSVPAPSKILPGTPIGEAVPIGKIDPKYPPLSEKLGEEGEVIFLLEIDEKGGVSKVTVDKSSGHSRLDEAAEAAIRAAEFRPANLAGNPVASTKRLRVEFRIQNR